MSGSEVARLRREIELRCEAAIRGLHEYAGIARHEVIARKMDAIGRCQEELEKLVGSNEAARIVVDAYFRSALLSEASSVGAPCPRGGWSAEYRSTSRRQAVIGRTESEKWARSQDR